MALHLLSSSPGVHSQMNSVAPLVLTLLDLFATCPPRSTPLLAKVSWIGGKCTSPFRAALYFSSGYGLKCDYALVH